MKKLLKLLGVFLAAALVTTGLNGCAVAALTAASAYAASSGDDDTAWELLKGTMWEAVAGQLGYNWLGLMWA
jgi:hypothetical protein